MVCLRPTGSCQDRQAAPAALAATRPYHSTYNPATGLQTVRLLPHTIPPKKAHKLYTLVIPPGSSRCPPPPGPCPPQSPAPGHAVPAQHRGGRAMGELGLNGCICALQPPVQPLRLAATHSAANSGDTGGSCKQAACCWAAWQRQASKEPWRVGLCIAAMHAALIAAAKAAAAPQTHLGVAQRGGAPRLVLLLEPAILPQLHALCRHLEHLWGDRAATGQKQW